MASMPQKTRLASAATQPMPERLEPAPGQSMENFLIQEFGPPGLRARNAIPPTDDPRYRLFQKELGLKKDQQLSQYAPKPK